MSDITSTFNAEYEAGRRFFIPALEALRSLKRVKRAVYLDGWKGSGRVFELTMLWKAGRIKYAAPGGITPARNPDERSAHRLLTPSTGQFFAITVICRRYIEIQRSEQIIPRIADFVLVASFDKHE